MDAGTFVECLFDNEEVDPRELAFKEGDVLLVLSTEVGADGWVHCSTPDRTHHGLVPSNFVAPLDASIISARTASTPAPTPTSDAGARVANTGNTLASSSTDDDAGVPGAAPPLPRQTVVAQEIVVDEGPSAYINSDEIIYSRAAPSPRAATTFTTGPITRSRSRSRNRRSTLKRGASSMSCEPADASAASSSVSVHINQPRSSPGHPRKQRVLDSRQAAPCDEEGIYDVASTTLRVPNDTMITGRYSPEYEDIDCLRASLDATFMTQPLQSTPTALNTTKRHAPPTAQKAAPQVPPPRNALLSPERVALVTDDQFASVDMEYLRLSISVQNIVLNPNLNTKKKKVFKAALQQAEQAMEAFITRVMGTVDAMEHADSFRPSFEYYTGHIRQAWATVQAASNTLKKKKKSSKAAVYRQQFLDALNSLLHHCTPVKERLRSMTDRSAGETTTAPPNPAAAATGTGTDTRRSSAASACYVKLHNQPEPRGRVYSVPSLQAAEASFQVVLPTAEGERSRLVPAENALTADQIDALYAKATPTKDRVQRRAPALAPRALADLSVNTDSPFRSILGGKQVTKLEVMSKSLMNQVTALQEDLFNSACQPADEPVSFAGLADGLGDVMRLASKLAGEDNNTSQHGPSKGIESLLHQLEEQSTRAFGGKDRTQFATINRLLSQVAVVGRECVAAAGH